MGMKKIYKFIILCICSMIITTSCNTIKKIENKEIIDTTKEKPVQETNDNKNTVDQNNIEEQIPKQSNVSIEGNLVTINLPKRFQYEGEVGELTVEKIQSGFIESKLNEDESISYTMEKKDYKPYVNSFKEGIILRFKTLQKTTAYKTIEKFDFNSELTKAVFWVKKDSYFGSGEESASKNVAREMAYYQIFSGISEQDVDVEVKILNHDNNEELEKIIY